MSHEVECDLTYCGNDHPDGLFEVWPCSCRCTCSELSSAFHRGIDALAARVRERCLRERHVHGIVDGQRIEEVCDECEEMIAAAREEGDRSE